MECHTWSPTTYYAVVSNSRRTINAEYGPSAPITVHAASYESGDIYLLEYEIMYVFTVFGASPNAAYNFKNSFLLSEINLLVNPFVPMSGSPPSGIHAMLIGSSQMLVLAGDDVYRYNRVLQAWTIHGAVFCPLEVLPGILFTLNSNFH